MLDSLINKVSRRVLGLTRPRSVSPTPPAATPGLAPPICDDIRAWGLAHPGVNYTALEGPRTIHRNPPRTLEAAIDPAFEPYLAKEIPEKALVTVSGARVVGRNGLVVLPDGSYVGELIANGPEGRRIMLANEPAYHSPLPSAERNLSGDYFSLMVIGWTNYYHWTHDVVLKLGLALDKLPPECRFIAPPSLRPFQHEMLDLLGISRDRLTHFEPDQMWRLERLHFVIPYPKPSVDAHDYLAWFKAAAQARYPAASMAARRRIYLSRRSDTHFRTVNEDQVLECLHAYGFETQFPGQMTFREQVELFSQAEVLVGTGTGLSNMVFAPSGARILQFQDPTHMVVALYTLSEALGHTYWYLTGEAVANTDYPTMDADIFVPLDKLSRTLEAMLGQA